MYFGKKLSLYFKRMRKRNIKNRVSGWMALGTLNNLITYKNAFMQLYSWSLRSPFFFFDTASLFLFIKTPFFPKLSSSGILCKIFNDSATHFRSQNEICAGFFKNFFANDLRNFFATFWLHFYVKCKVYHKN